MTERRAHFSQRDLARAMRAAKAAGMEGRYCFEIDGSKIKIIPLDANGAAGAALDGNGAAANPWDGVLTDDAG